LVGLLEREIDPLKDLPPTEGSTIKKKPDMHPCLGRDSNPDHAIRKSNTTRALDRVVTGTGRIHRFRT